MFICYIYLYIYLQHTIYTGKQNLQSPGTLKIYVHLGENKNEEVKEILRLIKHNITIRSFIKRPADSTTSTTKGQTDTTSRQTSSTSRKSSTTSGKKSTMSKKKQVLGLVKQVLRVGEEYYD